MEEILLKIGEFFHSDLIIANSGILVLAITYIINTVVTAIKNRKTVKIKIDNEETNRDIKRLEDKVKTLEELSKGLKDILIVMVRYSRLSDEAKTKIEDIYEGEEDVDLTHEEENNESNLDNRTVIERLSSELED